MTTLPAPNAAMERLEKTWRDTATVADSSDVAHTFRYCADELATLRQTLAQQEAVSVEVYSIHDGVGTFNCPTFISVGDKLFTAPVAHSQAGVDEAMVERAMAAYVAQRQENGQTIVREGIRAAITAALTPAAGSEEKS